MKFNLDSANRRFYIEGYFTAGIRIAGQYYTSNLLLMPDQILTEWCQKPISALETADFAPILETPPDILLLGTGSQQRFPDIRLRAELARQRIGLETMDTEAACRTFNVLLAERRNVAAALVIRA